MVGGDLGSEMELIEGTIVKQKTTRVNGSDYFLINKELKEYLGIENGSDVKLVIKLDKGKHGRFICVGVEKNK